MDRLKQKRKTQRSQITKVLSEIDAAVEREVLVEEELRILLARLNIIHGQLKETDAAIEPLWTDGEAEQEYARTIEYNDRVVACSARLSFKITIASADGARTSDRTSDSGNGSSGSSVKVKLPKLELLRFNGDSLQWQPFWEQFEQVVHNNRELSPTDKFNYLRAALSEEAAAAIAGLPATASCYEDARDILKTRFGDEKRLIDDHMTRLLERQRIRSSLDVRGLRRLHDDLQGNIRGLRSLGVSEETFSTLLYPLILRLLPEDLVLDYHRTAVRDEEYRRLSTQSAALASDNSDQERGQQRQLPILLRFLRVEVESRERTFCTKKTDHRLKDSSEEKHLAAISKEGTARSWTNKGTAAALLQRTDNRECAFCKSTNHDTEVCSETMSLTEKRQILQNAGRCFKCTKRNHLAKKCRNKITCSECQGRHATVMCDPEFLSRSSDKPETQRKNEVSTSPVTLQAAVAEEAKKTVLLQTATVWSSGSKQRALIRVLFDGGSQRSFITKMRSRELGCQHLGNERLTVGTFGDHNTKKTFHRVLVTLENRHSGELFRLEALEADQICGHRLPYPSEEVSRQLEAMGGVIADLYMEDCAVGVDVLVGSDHYWDFVTGKNRKLNGKLRAVETSLGWTMQGPMELSSTVVHCSQVVSLNATTTESTTSEVLQKFWDLETMGATETFSTEGDPVNQRFEETIRKNNQRYEVSLPWKDTANLGDNRRIAEKRLQLLTKRLIRNAELMREYDATIQTYTKTDVAEPVASEQAGKRLYYMPHQAVHRESSTTTKLRVVFDASSHSSGSKSLNDCLKSGPNLNRDIVGILLNFRRHRVALVADIEKAFLQINIAAEDRDALRFLWYETTPEVGKPLPPIIEWRMTRVPFGTTSSPFLLAATLRHHLETMASEYPETAPLLRDSLYVDDILTGAANEAEGLKICTEATEIFQQASMKLHKWASNSNNLLQQICAKQEGDKPLGQIAGFLKVLGLNWQPNEDILTFYPGDVVKFLERKTDTKRFVLQTTARLYDPLGFIAPFVVRAKILLQRIWQLNLDWDDPLPWGLLTEWHKWCEELASLCDVMVPRLYWQGMKGTPTRKVLHVFADASPVAYGAVAFLTTMGDCGDTVATMVLCKSRVAPLKEVSLARLELLACLIATRLSNYIQTELHEDIQEIHLWTDSKIALCWILGEACRWKPFVSNRVAEIQSKSDSVNWRHCPGKENPADLVTRGISASELLRSETWWSGPSWLTNRSMWPQQAESQDDTAESHEEERVTTLTTISNATVTPEIKRFSSALRLVRTTAWMLRFINKARRTSADSGPLTVEELNRAERLLIEQVQRVAFAEELKSIREGKTLPAGSILRTVPLFIDNGLLRVTGRLQFSGKPYDEQHPVVLPKDHPFSSLLVNQAHRRLIHAGVRDTLVQLRERFWILRARQLVKKEIGKCIPCRRLNARPLTEVTAPLPSDRVTEAGAFEIVGIDFAGPLWVSTKASTKKAYLTLFTCAVTRAIHLELVPDLTTEAFLRALRRFTSRRGLPRVVYSDNALTFKRANKEMKELWNMLRNEELKDYFSKNRIHWKFIAERAPWWGGFYERLVRSVKTSLKKAIGRRLLTEEELGTLLSEIEAVINSRPLTFTYNESQEPQPLSPSCFLVGKRLTSLPNPTVPDIKDVEAEALRKLWKHRQEVMKSFWQRWSKEYLTELGSLHATKQSRHQIKVGDLVLLRESMQPRQLWKTGIVQQVFPGRDDKVRSCEVRLPDGTTVRRPVQLLYCLELSECEKTY